MEDKHKKTESKKKNSDQWQIAQQPKGKPKQKSKQEKIINKIRTSKKENKQTTTTKSVKAQKQNEKQQKHHKPETEPNSSTQFRWSSTEDTITTTHKIKIRTYKQ